jgi:hypothetical protein
VAEKYRYSYTFGKIEPKGQIMRIECWKGEDIETWNVSPDAGALEKWVGHVAKPVVGKLTRKNEMDYLNVLHTTLSLLPSHH